MKYNVIRWPDADGGWWFVAERTPTSGYTPLMQLYPKWEKDRTLLPTYQNQLWMAAELVANQGLDALNNPHASTGRICGCRSCFCCAALAVYKAAREVKP